MDKRPLAERMRPETLAQVVGQEHLVGVGKIIREIIEKKQPTSLILWGPPGSGKTTLARIIAHETDAEFIELSAVTAKKADVIDVVRQAEVNRRLGMRTILFVDEIHRFNKAQQDAFLPHVEDGTIILIGATTENPSFEVINPLLSRSRVLVLEPLGAEALGSVIDRALTDVERGLGRTELTLVPAARDFLIAHAQGDARVALNTLETAARLARNRRTHTLDLPLFEEAAQQRALRYDKAGEEHYNVISAFIKSLRGGDPDAAVYW